MKTVVLLFGLVLVFIIGGCHSQIPETTVAQYHYTIFKIFFDAALGPDASENSKTCPGICMPSSTAVFCPKVLDDMPCFTPNTKCCIRRNESEPADPQTAVQMPNLSVADVTKSGDSDVFNASDYQNDPFLCPGYCVLNTLQSDCESPAVIIPNTSDCAEEAVCCDDTRLPVTPKPTKRPRPRPTHATTTGAPTFWQATIDSRKECPGICIANLIRFTCYGNAEVTDLFKCRRPTTTCCANKELVHETLAQLYFNQPIPPHGHDTFLSHGHESFLSHDALQKYGEPGSNEGDNTEDKENACPGVCVANQFSGYCEAYLSANDLCESGSRCCVSRETPLKPMNNRIGTKNGQTNHTLPVANPAVQLISMIINPERSTSTTKPIKTTVIEVESESKDSLPQIIESTTSQIVQSFTESNSGSSKTKLLTETTPKTVEDERVDASTAKAIESIILQTTSDTQSPQSSSESTPVVTEMKLETEKLILNNV